MKANTQLRKGRAQDLGRWGEYACKVFLRLSGWTILHQGYRGPRGTGAGEIDLIVKRRNMLAFIEVKARPTIDTGLRAVSFEQQQRIIRSADRFLANNPQFHGFDIRFDVMIVRPWHLPKRFADAWRPLL